MVFDTEMFEKYQILTSKEIPKNFFRVISRRKNFEIEHPEYLLIAIPEKRTNWGNVCKNGEIAYKNAKNVDNFQQSKVKESKVKESKENTTPCSRAREGEKSIICYFWLDPKVTKRSRLHSRGCKFTSLR